MKRGLKVFASLPILGFALSLGAVFASWQYASGDGPSFDERQETANVGIDDVWAFPKNIVASVHSHDTNTTAEVALQEVDVPDEGYIQQWEADIVTTDSDHADIMFTLDGADFVYRYDDDTKWHVADDGRFNETNLDNKQTYYSFRAFYGATYHFKVRYDGASYSVSCSDDNPTNYSVLILNVNSKYPHVYLWKDQTEIKNDKWPGITLSSPWVSSQSNKPLYYLIFPKGTYDRLIINNKNAGSDAGEQTPDIVINSGAPFAYQRFWLDSTTSFGWY